MLYIPQPVEFLQFRITEERMHNGLIKLIEQEILAQFDIEVRVDDMRYW